MGRTVELETLDTPGHTRAHVCLLAHGDAPALFCGDTLFNAGAGNCHNGGDSGLLYETFVEPARQTTRGARACTRGTNTWRATWPSRWIASQATRMPRDRWPRRGHTIRRRRASPRWVKRKRINAFLRLSNPEIVARLREKFPEIGEKPDARTVFVKLRELRNRW